MHIPSSGRPRRKDNTGALAQAPMTRIQDSERNIKSALKKIIGHSSRARITALYEGFLASGKYTEIHDTLSGLEDLHKSVRKSDSANWTPASSVALVMESPLSLAIRNIIKALEDLLLNIMEGADVKGLALRELLLFQVASDVTLIDE